MFYFCLQSGDFDPTVTIYKTLLVISTCLICLQTILNLTYTLILVTKKKGFSFEYETKTK